MPNQKAFSQTVINGKIISKLNKTPLPFVAISFKKGDQAVLSDIDGKFELKVKPEEENDVIYIHYLGYLPYQTTAAELKKMEKVVLELKPKTIDLMEVKVTPSKNPAHRIIENVLKNRDINNPEKMQSFRYVSYNKMVVTRADKEKADSILKLDSIPKGEIDKFFRDQHLLLTESVSERNYKYPGKNNERVTASRVSGFKASPFTLLATQLQSFSFYNDFIEVLNVKYLNPISAGSLSRYVFILEDTLQQGGDSVFIIRYYPKKDKNFKGLSGTLYINSNAYAVQNVLAGPARMEKGDINFSIQQQYERIENKQWFPTQLNTDWVWDNLALNVSVSSGGAKGENNEVKLKSVCRTSIRNIELNPEISNKIFSEVEISMDKKADKQDESFWNKYRVDSLDKKDRSTYHVIDSIGKATNLDRKIQILEVLATGKIPIYFIDLDLDRIMQINDFEGYRVGLGAHTNRKLSEYFTVGGYFGISSKNKFIDSRGKKRHQWKYGADLSVLLWKKKELRINAIFENDVTEAAGSKFFENKFQLSNTEMNRQFLIPTMEWYQKFQGGFSFRAFKYLRVNTYAMQMQRWGMIPFADRSKQEIVLRDSLKISEVGIQFKFLFREKFMQTLKNKISLGSDYPVFYLNLAKGFETSQGFISGDKEYFKTEFKMDYKLRHRHIGITNLQLQCGLIDGVLPYGLLFNNKASGTQGFFVSTTNTFETMRINEFVSDQYAALFFAHNIGRFLKPRKKFNPEFELVHNMGWGSIRKSNEAMIFNFPYRTLEKGFFESGFRIHNIIKNGLYGLGVGTSYRYGPYAFKDPMDNLTVRLAINFAL